MSKNIQEWFRNSDHLLLWRGLQKELNFENGLDVKASREGESVKRISNPAKDAGIRNSLHTI